MKDFRRNISRNISSYSVKDGIKHGIIYKCKIYWQNIKTAFHYVANDNKKNPRSFIIGSSTVFLVVFFLCLIQNALKRSSVLLVKAQEDIVGKYDLVLSPSTNSEGQFSLLNYTHINEKTKDLSEVAGSAPRWALTAEAMNNEYSGSLYTFFLNTTLEKEIGLASHWPFRKLGNNEILLSSSLIRTLHVQPNAGQTITLQFNFTSLITEVYPDMEFKSDIMNDVINEIIKKTEYSDKEYDQIINQYLKKTDSINKINKSYDKVIKNGLIISNNYLVVDDIDKSYGMFPSTLGNVGVIELEQIKNLIFKLVENIVNELINSEYPINISFDVSKIKDIDNIFNPVENALMVIVMKNNRMESYTKSHANAKKDIIRFTNQVADSLGFNFTAEYTSVLFLAVNSSEVLMVFLDELFFSIISVLCLLMVILIYSLLMTDVEEKTFEYGMIRSLGLHHTVLIIILLFQSLFFSIPGIILGVFLCKIVYIPVDYVISQYAETSIDVRISTSALILGVGIGFFIPIFGIVGLVKRALTKTLRDALDIYHRVVSETQVKIKKLEDIGMSLPEIAISIIMVVIGFGVYYGVPTAYVSQNYALFFRFLTLLLLVMILGETLLGQVINNLLEKVCVSLVIWGPNKKLKIVVKKNLQNHFSRNSKTSIMFSLCLAYIIFAAALFSLMGGSLSRQIEWTTGADISIVAKSFDTPLPEDEIRALLDSNSITDDEDLIEEYSFVTYPLNYNSQVRSTSLCPVSGISCKYVEFFGVETNILKTLLTRYYSVEEYDNKYIYNNDPILSLNQNIDTLKDIVDYIPESFESINKGTVTTKTKPKYYYPLNSTRTYSIAYPILIGSNFMEETYTTISDWLPLIIDGNDNDISEVYLLKPIGILNKFPGFTDISSGMLSNGYVGFLSMDNYNRFLNLTTEFLYIANPPTKTVDVYKYHEQSLKKYLFIKVKKDATDFQIEDIINNILRYIDDSTKFSVNNLRHSVKSTNSIADLLNNIFYFIAFLGIFMCSFMCYLSFTANLKENSWEFGILRSIGLSAVEVINVYIYEAICIILSCVVVGTSIGLISAVIITMQFNLFMQLPFTLSFPFFMFFELVILSLIVAIFGSYIPGKQYAEKPINEVIKGKL
ncbi:hypothetical protein BCR32DRAFT_292904 [Anaeromyces robustus]|uniref:ABC3 transporter permease C-terminal domain-containing protein n=1 Tax=Anaeromyces robustus TaxID=1754192 RepID=A0A1Y1X8I5_9FUNG|nr:hypothetical protein BCR32DRAFT_292904 [Anaeromyces robustus]|eukprot:ORX82075.1 hypothetical protein BCR32DRAFT_292904 [Anaeromyces robustus]